MAIKLSSKNRDNIPTLTEIVAEEANQAAQDGDSAKEDTVVKNGVANGSLPPKFERLLEKIIYKKLHQQLVDTSQSLAADIMAELKKYLQPAGKTQNKPDKNPD